MGDYAKAERFYLEAKDILERTLGREHPDYATLLSNLSFFYQNMGKYTEAAELKESVCGLKTNLINRNFSFLSEQQRALYWNTIAIEFEAAYSLSYFHSVAAVNSLNYNNTLFSKGLLLRTTIAVRDAIYSSGNAALIAQYEELGRLREQISRQQQNNGDREYIQNLETRVDTLDKSLAQASVEFRDLKADMAMGWQDVQKVLEPGEAAVEFVSFRLFDKGWKETLLAALILRPGMEAPAWVPLCDEASIQEILQYASEKIKTVDENKKTPAQTEAIYDESGAALYRLIWQPLEKELTGVKTIYYSPSGLLHKISFNAIPTTEDNSLRLADTYDLNLVSSTREVAHRDRTDAPALTSAAIYGGLLYDVNATAMRQAARPYQQQGGDRLASARGVGRGGTWGYLLWTDEEAWTVQGQVKARNIPNTRYSGREGNEESFKQLDGAKTGLIHLATHGFFLEDIEEKAEDRDRVQRLGGGAQKAFENPLLRSGLILAGGNNAWNNNPVEGVEDGILTADEIARLNLTGTRLVVLSACQTGLGDVNNSEGVFGLQRAFKLAGVETLIMSLWNVDDKTTADLMTAFYEGWLSGKSKQEAFKEAQRQVRAKTPEPYYWAAFVIMD